MVTLVTVRSSHASTNFFATVWRERRKGSDVRKDRLLMSGEFGPIALTATHTWLIRSRSYGPSVQLVIF